MEELIQVSPGEGGDVRLEASSGAVGWLVEWGRARRTSSGWVMPGTALWALLRACPVPVVLWVPSVAVVPAQGRGGRRLPGRAPQQLPPDPEPRAPRVSGLCDEHARPVPHEGCPVTARRLGEPRTPAPVPSWVRAITAQKPRRGTATATAAVGEGESLPGLSEGRTGPLRPEAGGGS